MFIASTPKRVSILSSEKNARFQAEVKQLVLRDSKLSPNAISSFLQHIYTRKIDQSVGHTQLVSLLRLSLKVVTEIAKITSGSTPLYRQ